MSDGDSKSTFDYFTREYAEALQAFETIEEQSPTLLAFGGTEDLRAFLDQFITMTGRAHDEAIEKSEPNFAEWFRELREKAEALRASLDA